ncbi:DUF4376 domain-containing protein [Methylobacterium sp. JK268]
MTTLITYDPVFRNLTGTCATTQPDEVATAMRAAGAALIAHEGPMPGSFEALYVDADGKLRLRKPLPDAIRLADLTVDAAYTVPTFPDLPEAGVVEPPAGTVLPTGVTSQVRIRAPRYLDHVYHVHVWTPADEKASLLAWAANRRWELEQLGAPWQGHRVATDDRSKILLMGSVMAAQVTGASWSTVWEFVGGEGVRVTGADVTAMSLAVQDYVNRLFVIYDGIKGQIASGGITTTDAIKAAFLAGLAG